MTNPVGRTFTLALLTCLAIGIGVSYSNSLAIGFLFDDSYGIAKNPAIRSLWNIPSFFTDPFTLTTLRENVDVRPILQVTFALNYAVSGLNSWSYHLLNLVLHFIGAVLVFFVVRDYLWWPENERGGSGEGRIVAAAAAVFFALAPLNSQPLDYMWARSALLCTTFYLAAFLAFLRGRWHFMALFHALALLTKAIAITLPAVILLYDYLYRDRARYPTVGDYLRNWRRLALPVLLSVALNVAYLTYRWTLLPPWAEQARHEAFVTPWIWFMSQWSVYLYYIRLFLWPDALSIDHGYPYTFSILAPRAWLSLSALIVWIGAAFRTAPRYPLFAFTTGWYFITLAPESTFAPLAEVINDHRPYIASALGLSVLLAWLLYCITAVFGARRFPAFATISFLLCVLAIPVTRYRNWQWQDSIRLWEDTIRKNPNNGRAWMNTGQEHMARGDLASARRYFKRAKALSPSYAYIYMNLSVLETHEGRLDNALRAAEQAVRLRPGLAPTHYYLGRVLEKLGRVDDALAAYRHGLTIDPRHHNLQEALARLSKRGADSTGSMMKAGLNALYKFNNPNQAVTIFRKVLEMNPTHYGATYQLATALDRADKPEEAHPVWAKMLEMAEAINDQRTIDAVRARLKEARDIK